METKPPNPYAVLVGIQPPDVDDTAHEASLEELARPMKTLGYAVVGVPDEGKGELAHAYIVRHRDEPVSEADILAHCRLHLAAYKVPRALWFVDGLPRTSTGKIMRRALCEQRP